MKVDPVLVVRARQLAFSRVRSDGQFPLPANFTAAGLTVGASATVNVAYLSDAGASWEGPFENFAASFGPATGSYFQTA